MACVHACMFACLPTCVAVVHMSLWSCRHAPTSCPHATIVAAAAAALQKESLESEPPADVEQGAADEGEAERGQKLTKEEVLDKWKSRALAYQQVRVTLFCDCAMPPACTEAHARGVDSCVARVRGIHCAVNMCRCHVRAEHQQSQPQGCGGVEKVRQNVDRHIARRECGACAQRSGSVLVC